MIPELKQTNHTRYEYLDALRGIAVLGVLSIHAAMYAGADFFGSKYALAGQYGVHLFFMISSITIFMTLERAKTKEIGVHTNFYIRRLFRILPMFWVGIVIYIFAPGREHYDQAFNIDISYYLLTATLQHGWHPFVINSVVPGGWSIADEGTFYIIVPLLFFLIKDWKRAFYFILIALTITKTANYVFSVLTAKHLIFQNVANADVLNMFAFRWFPSQLPVFAFGIFTFFILKNIPAHFRTKTNGIILLLTALVLLLSCEGIGNQMLIPVQVFYAAGFMFLILALGVYPHKLFVNKLTCFIGKISFSIYLLHFFMLTIAKEILINYLPFTYSKHILAYISIFLLTLIITMPVSWLAYKFIEQPCIRLGTYFIRRGEDIRKKNM